MNLSALDLRNVRIKSMIVDYWLWTILVNGHQPEPLAVLEDYSTLEAAERNVPGLTQDLTPEVYRKLISEALDVATSDFMRAREAVQLAAGISRASIHESSNKSGGNE